MLSQQFRDSLYNDPRIQAIEMRYEAANVPFKPAFEKIAEKVTGGIDNYETSTLVQQLIVALLSFLDAEIASCTSDKWYAKAGKVVLKILKFWKW